MPVLGQKNNSAEAGGILASRKKAKSFENVLGVKPPTINVTQTPLAQQVEQTPIEPKEQEKPFLYRIQKDIWDKTGGPITEKAMRFAANVTDPFHIARGIAEREGVDLRSNPIYSGMSTPETSAEKVTDVAGQIAGSIGPGVLAYKTGGKLAGSALTKLLPGAPKLAQTAVRGVGAGATFGATREALEAATGDEQSIGGRLKDIAIDTAIGGAGDAAISAAAPVLGRALRSGMSRLQNLRGSVPEPVPANSQTRLPIEDSTNPTLLQTTKQADAMLPDTTPVSETVKPIEEPAAKQDWFTSLFGQKGVGIVPGATSGKELIDTHIVSNPKKTGSLIARVGDATDNAKQELVDRFAPFKLVDKETYDAAMDSTRANNLANITIKDKFVDLEGNVLGKSLKEVYDNVPRGMRHIADRYTVMRDAVNRMDRGLSVYGDEKWFPKTSDEAAELVAKLEQQHPWLKNFGEDWNQFNRNRQDLWVSSGLVSQGTIDTLRHTNPNYSQMFRQQDAAGLKGKLSINTSRSGFSGQKAPIKRAVGSTKKIIEPAQGMIETTGSSYNAMMRNRAMEKLYNAVKSNPEKYKGVLDIVEETAEAKQAGLKAINDALAENGPDGVAELLNNEINGIFKKAKQAANGKGETVTVMVQGEPVKMRISDPSLLKAVEGVSPEQLGAIANVFNTVSKGIKYSATGGLAPLQGLKLAFRDLPLAAAQSKDKLRFPLDISHALISQVADWLPDYIPGAQKLGDLARQYYRAGGGYEAYLKGDSKIRTMSADLTKDPILSGRNLLKTARKVNPFRPLKGLGDAMENIPRIAAFSAEMRKNGWNRSPENVRSAIDAGREATVNWSRRGYRGAEIEAFLPYSNAAVQGTYRIIKRFKEQPISAIALIMGIAGAKIAAYEKFKNDPDYKQRSRFEKGIPYAKTNDGKFKTIPVEPTEAFIADQVLNFYKWANDGQEAPSAKESIQEGAEAFLPKYASGPISAFTSPGKSIDLKNALSTTSGGSAFEPVSAVVTGKNHFGGDIVPREYQGLPTHLQYNETTSSAGKWAAENLGIDAFTFDYLGQKFGGDIAKVGLPMTSDVGKGDPTGNIVDETLTRLKLLEDPVMKNRIADDFFNYSDSVSQVKEAFNRKDIPLPSWYQNAYDEVTSTKKDSLTTRINELNTKKKDVQRNIIDAKQRADMLREVQSQINLLRIQGIKRLEELGVPKAKGR